jgi:hypothetical protein
MVAKMHVLLKALFILILFPSFNVVNAAIIEGYFKGKVNDIFEAADYWPQYIDFFSSNALNSDFTGSFQYDSDRAPGNMVDDVSPWEESKGGYLIFGHGAPSRWIDISFNVDGKNLNPDITPDNSQTPNYFGQRFNIGSEYDVARDGRPESFGAHISSTYSFFGSHDLYQNFFISFDGSLNYLFDKNSLEQNVNWVDASDYIFEENKPPLGWAMYQVGNDGLGGYHSILQLQITEISIRTIKSTAVTESSSIGLLLFALLFTVFLRHYRSEHS